MAIVIEDGTIVSGANSWIDLAYLEAYKVDMGYTGDAGIESDLIQSYSFLKYQPWCINQSVEYTVTDEHKNGQAETAYQVRLGFDIVSPLDTDRVKSEKVDVLRTEFFDNTGRSSNSYITLKSIPVAFNMLNSLLCPNNCNYLLRA